MPPPATILACVLLGGPALLVWAFDLAMLRSLTGSDAFGDGMTQGAAVIATILLWGLLSLFILTAAIGGKVAPAALVAALLLIPASGLAAGAAFQLLIRPENPPFFWPLLVPAAVPPLVLAFGVWAVVPLFRTAFPAAPFVVWGLVLAVSLAILPMRQARLSFDAAAAAAEAQARAALQALPSDAPVQALTPFLNEKGTGHIDIEIRDRLRQLPSRQGDVEAMLAANAFPFARISLPVLELAPTPTLCALARGALAARAAVLVTAPAGKSYRSIAWEAERAISSLEWLNTAGCAVPDAAKAWQEVLQRYPDVGWDQYRLAALLAS